MVNPKSKQFRPMLAAPIEDRESIRFPVLASEKLDGVRALVKDGVLLSRKLIPIPNEHLQTLFGQPALEGFDGELLLRSSDGNIFTETQSAAMSFDGQPDMIFHVFDDFTDPTLPYHERLASVARRWKGIAHLQNSVRPLATITCMNLEALEDLEKQVLAKSPTHGQKGEGVMIRDPHGPYKFNRSTTNEGWLLKVKRFKDSDARILGFKERLKNTNEAETDERGLTKRSHSKEGKVLTGLLGSFIVQDIHTGVKFDVGSGLTLEQRKLWWDDRENLKGRIIKYKYFEEASKGKPRFPVFLAMRDERDVIVDEPPEELF